MILIFLTAAGFFAGLIDSVAGGGGLISLPALLAAGVPPYLALGTNKFQSTLGTTCALFNFHRKAKVIWKVALIGVPCAFLGSVAGARLALLINQTVLAKVLVVILPPAAILMFFSKRLSFPRKRESRAHARGSSLCGDDNAVIINFWVLTPLMCLLLGVYDGFFGPGTGTFLIVGLALVSHLPLINASATAKTFNLASNVGAFVTFIVSGHVDYLIGACMAGGNILGNFVGSHFAVKHGNALVNKVVYVSLTLLFIYLIVKYF
jgi:uncharacterized membrane protein YfcA